MSGSSLVFWESAKYSISVCFLLFIFKNIYKNKSFFVYPIFYIFIMCLSTIFLDFSQDPVKSVSFNLSGHICLGLSLIYFFDKNLSGKLLILIHMAMIVPIYSTAAMGLYEIVFQFDQIVFARETNQILSGDFGGNQYSIMVGHCAFFSIISLIYFQRFLDKKAIIFLVLTSILMTTFSLITFSRTSLYLASISLLLPLIIKLQFSIKKNLFFLRSHFIIYYNYGSNF